MTNQTSATESAASAAAPGTGSPASPPPGAPKAKAKSRQSSSAVGTLTAALVIVLLLAVGLSWALWLQRKQFLAAGREVATRLDTLEQSAAQSRKEAREALALAQAQADRKSTRLNSSH